MHNSFWKSKKTEKYINYKKHNISMKKTTIKISWDNLQSVNLIALKESRKKGEKVTQDQVIRILVELYNKK